MKPARKKPHRETTYLAGAKQEEALRSSQEYFRALMENSPDAVTIIDEDGTVRYESPSYERLLGFKLGDRVGNNLVERIHPDDTTRVAELFTEFLQNRGGTLRAEARAKHNDGLWRFVDAIGSNLLDNPIMKGIVVNLCDITERRHMRKIHRAPETMLDYTMREGYRASSQMKRGANNGRGSHSHYGSRHTGTVRAGFQRDGIWEKKIYGSCSYAGDRWLIRQILRWRTKAMIKKVLFPIALLVLLVVLAVTMATPAMADTLPGVLPIHETFMNTTAPGWILGGTASLTSGNGDPAGQGWLRLTTAGNNQAGYAYYDMAFPSNQGVRVSFEYVAWGGTGADGLGFFLFDGGTPTFRIGDAGGSLGYANGIGSIRGLSNGYVGIGVDEWGNFAAYDTSRHHHGYLQYNRVPHSVTIRGSGDGNESATYDYYYLTSTGTIPGYTIDISGYSQRPDLSGANYRKVDMIITPDEKITVKMQFGSANPLTTLIDGYDLAAAPHQADIPGTFKLGFFGATGGSTNYHEIRNLTVTCLSDLALTKTVDKPTPCEGSNITYTLRVDNNGPSDATNIQVTDRLPGNVTYVSHNPSQGNYNSGTGLWTVGTVTNGGTATLLITAKVNTGTGGTTITNTVNITYCDQGDSVPSNDSDTADIIVRVSPVASAGSNSPRCEGSTISLIGGPDGMSSYSWTGPGGWSSSLQNSTRPNAALAMAGTYTLTVTDANGCSGNATTNVVVNARPVATASSNSPICQGATISLTGGPGGMTTYSWIGPNSFLSSLQNPTRPNATLAMAGTYTLTVTDANGCSGNATTNVVVNDAPVAADDAYSTDEDVTLNVAAPGVLGNDTDVDGDLLTAILVTDVSNGSLTLNPDGSFSYTPDLNYNGPDSFTYKANDGAADSNIATVSITINPVNDAPVATASSNSPVCQGATISLTGGPDGMDSYSWVGPGFTSTDRNPTRLDATTGMSGDYTLTVTKDGCSGNKTINVVVNPNPVCGINPIAGPVCADSTGHTASVITPQIGVSYFWTVTGGTITAGQGNPSITWTAGTGTQATMSVRVTNLTTSCYCEDSEVVTINPLPNCTITAPAQVAAGSTGNPASVADAGPGATYAWTISGGSITGGTDTRTITWTAGDGLTVGLGVTVTNANGCSSVCTGTVAVTTEEEHILTVSVVGCCGVELNGRLINTPFIGAFAPDTPIELNAVEGTCCTLDTWTLDGARLYDSQISFNVDSDHQAVVYCSPPQVIQLAVLLDGSSSMDTEEWNTQITGLRDAVLDPECMPDCKVELTVIQFAGGIATTEVSPTIIGDHNRAEIADQMETIVHRKGITSTDLGIKLAVNELTSSPYFSTAIKQIINISSDVQDSTLYRDRIKTARDAAIVAGIDEINAEGIGDFRIPIDLDWMKNDIVYPEGADGSGHVAPPFTPPGWVYVVGLDDAKFKLAICEKISPPPVEVWDMPYGTDVDPATFNAWPYPSEDIEVSLVDVEDTIPSQLLVIWYYGGPGVGWQFFKPGWGDLNTLTELVPGNIYYAIVSHATSWEIPQ